MVKKEWVSWLKCNVLEIVILVLVLVLLVKAFSAPVPVENVGKVPRVEDLAALEEVLSEAGPVAEVPLEQTPAGEAPAKEVPVKETPQAK